MKILIVDDDPGIINAIRVGLISLGHKLVAAEDGCHALRIIEMSAEHDEPVEIMVADLKMPGMNGLELIQAVKQMRPKIATILITAYGSDKIENEISSIGCRYLEKPFTPEKLLKTICDLNGGKK